MIMFGTALIVPLHISTGDGALFLNISYHRFFSRLPRARDGRFELHPLSCIYTINRHQFVELYWQKNLQVDMKLRSIVFLLLVLFAGIIANAKTLKLSKNIIYEGAVQKGEPNGKGCLKVYSCLDKNLTLLTLDGVFNNTEVKDANLMISGGMKITAPSIYFYKIATPSKKEDAIDFQINSKWSIENTKSVKLKMHLLLILDVDVT